MVASRNVCSLLRLIKIPYFTSIFQEQISYFVNRDFEIQRRRKQRERQNDNWGVFLSVNPKTDVRS